MRRRKLWQSTEHVVGYCTMRDDLGKVSWMEETLYSWIVEAASRYGYRGIELALVDVTPMVGGLV